MGMLGADAGLPQQPHRILVSGTSGSGKSTLARAIGEVLGIPYTEIDGLFHGPNWVPRETFVADVERFTAEAAWVTEWQYNTVLGSLLPDRADLVVWIDLTRRTVMRQVIGRTVGRRLRRTVLWNGNVEGPFRTFFNNPDHIVRWAWKQHSRTAQKVWALHERRPELTIVRLRSRREVERWLHAQTTKYQPDGL
jgi:adenylate kinase family enzyme